MATGNPFYIPPVDVSSQLSGLGQVLGQVRERKAKEKRISEFRDAMTAAETPTDFANLAAIYPEYGQAANLGLTAKAQELGIQKQSMVDLYKGLYISDDPMATYEDFLEANPDVKLSDSMIEDMGMARQDPEKFKRNIAVMWASTDPKSFEAAQKAMEGKKPPAYTNTKTTSDGRVMGINPETGRYEIIPAPARVQKPSGTTVNVGAGQTEFDKGVGKGQATRYNAIQDSGVSATRTISTLNTLEKLSDDAFSGGMSNLKIGLGRVADALGMNVDGLAETEVFEAVSNRLTLEKAAELSGALSDKDVSFLQAIVPSLSQTKTGRKKLISISKDLAKIEKQYAKDAAQFKKETGKFNQYDFEDWLREKRGDDDLLSKYFDQGTSEQAKAKGIKYGDTVEDANGNKAIYHGIDANGDEIYEEL